MSQSAEQAEVTTDHRTERRALSAGIATIRDHGSGETNQRLSVADLDLSSSG